MSVKSSVKVSVIIPFYSQAEWLIEAVDSVFNQTFTDFEVLVINDGSDEDLSSFLDKYSDRIIYKRKENGGPGSARNLGIELAHGEYIALLDSDDIWDRQKLELQVRLMEESKAVWSHTHWVLFDDNNTENVTKTYRPDSNRNTFPGSLASLNIATPCVMIRTDYLKDNLHLRFHEKMRFGQDTYLWLLLSSEHDICLIPQVLCKVRLRGDNAATKARAHIQTRALIWKYLRNDPGNIFYRNRALAGIRCLYRLCKIEQNFLLWLEKKAGMNKSAIEMIAKIIYAVPYFGFKLYKKLLKQSY